MIVLSPRVIDTLKAAMEDLKSTNDFTSDQDFKLTLVMEPSEHATKMTDVVKVLIWTLIS